MWKVVIIGVYVVLIPTCSFFIKVMGLPFDYSFQKYLGEILKLQWDLDFMGWCDWTWQVPTSLDFHNETDSTIISRKSDLELLHWITLLPGGGGLAVEGIVKNNITFTSYLCWNTRHSMSTGQISPHIDRIQRWNEGE